MLLKLVLRCMLYLILSTTTIPVLKKHSYKRDQREGRVQHLSCVEHGAGSCLQSEPGQGSPPHAARRTRSPERGNESQVLPGPPWQVQPPFSRALHTTVPHAPRADDVARKLPAARRAEVSKNLHQGRSNSVRV